MGDEAAGNRSGPVEAAPPAWSGAEREGASPLPIPDPETPPPAAAPAGAEPGAATPPAHHVPAGRPGNVSAGAPPEND